MICLLDARQRRDNRVAKFARTLANGDVSGRSPVGADTVEHWHWALSVTSWASRRIHRSRRYCGDLHA